MLSMTLEEMEELLMESTKAVTFHQAEKKKKFCKGYHVTAWLEFD
jgi:hypothetical protein